MQCEREYAAAYAGPLYEGPVKVEMVFHAGQVRLLILPMADDWVKTPRGDVDNLVKTLGDGLNGVAWGDDKQIKWFDARKARKEEQ
jgi:Holliday junction resolvase RusA-like endonuclease